MRIIIVQAEIELAIRQYVLGQINIAEGQEITIDFKNTRGDDGATAEINIQKPLVPNEKPVEKSTQAVVQSRSPAPATKIAQTTASAVLAPAVTAGEAIASETEKSADSASTTTAQPDPASQTSETATAETLNQKEEEPVSGFPAKTPEYDAGREEELVKQEAAAEKPVQKPSFLNTPATAAADAAPAASGKSLFANLTKPVNPKPPAEG